MVVGRVFHKTGAALLNAWAPQAWLSWAKVADGHLPTSVFELERMLVGRRSVMYSGASPFSALYTWMSSLYCILCSTGSQWRFIRTCVIWSLIRVRVTTCAAMFWHFCSLATVSPGRPASRALFRSKCDVTKAWTIFSHESRSTNLLILPIFLMW